MHIRSYSQAMLAADDIKLVLPETGRIFIDGIDISTVDTQTLRSRVVCILSDIPAPRFPAQLYSSL